MTRRTIYSGGPDGEAYHIEEPGDGTTHLIRTTDVDDGPTRSVCISDRALRNVASAIHALAIRKGQS